MKKLQVFALAAAAALGQDSNSDPLNRKVVFEQMDSRNKIVVLKVNRDNCSDQLLLSFNALTVAGAREQAVKEKERVTNFADANPGSCVRPEDGKKPHPTDILDEKVPDRIIDAALNEARKLLSEANGPK